MKYACLVYYDEAIIDAMTGADWDALNRECMAYGEDIVASGHRLGGQALQPTSTATTVRVRNGTVSTSDGPFAETREQLAGFYLIEARDLNEAIQTAARIPPARLGSIEVRPVRELRAEDNTRGEQRTRVG
jgi:hypothetical protein